MTFSSFELDARVSAAIPKNYTNPTPIQAQAIPSVLAGKDVLGLAQTGTGKTAAFVLPILHRLVTNPATGPRGKPRSLIIAPTRELAEQICTAIRELGAKSRLSFTTIYGGVSMNAQIQQLRRGVDIVVGCPGRLLDLLNQRALDLRHVEVLVLDEADHMFDMGFLPTLRRILQALPTERQTLLFSATMPNEVHGLAMEVLRNPETIKVGTSAPISTVEHCMYRVDQANKTRLLLQIVSESSTGSVLVFTRTKHRAKKLGESLLDAGHSATSLQGNLSQQRRDAALRGFRTGKFRVMVATDIAARGIDVASVTHVINYDIPDTVEAYTHRIGRTGRAERTGDASTFVTPQDGGMVRSIERTLGSKIPSKEVEGISLPESAMRQSSGSGSSRSQRGPRSYGGSSFGRSQRGRSDNFRSDSQRSGSPRSDSGRSGFQGGRSDSAGGFGGSRSSGPGGGYGSRDGAGSSARSGGGSRGGFGSQRGGGGGGYRGPRRQGGRSQSSVAP